MKKIQLVVVLVLSCLVTVNGQQVIDNYLYSTVTYGLKREITTGIPAGIKAYKGKTSIAMAKKGTSSNAVIVKADKDENNQKGLLLQRELEKAWKVKVPLVDWDEARVGDKNLILFGAAKYNMPLRELDANNQLGNNEKGYEVRTIPNALSWGKDVIYINAGPDSDFEEAIGVLIKKSSKPDKIPYFIACKGWENEDAQNDHKVFIEELLAHYAKDDSRRNNIALETLLAKPVLKYKMTGNDAYVKTFAEMMNMILDRYDQFAGPNKTPPTFEFHIFPTYMYMVENSKAFLETDRLKAIEFMRRISEESMNFWEMVEPMKFYDADTKGYITNHSCFASRTVAASARYLLTRYNYEPARYWKEVADNGFDGVAPHPYSPEDAAGYQYLVYRIFTDYAILSGRYKLDFFKSPLFQGYLRFAKAQYNHLGYLAGYGDANALGHYSSHPFLKQAIELFDDEEAKYILRLINRNNAGKGIETPINMAPPGSDTHGLSYFTLDDFKQTQYKIKGFFNRPLLDKAIFRSGWDDKADFVTITGINGDGRNHGHFDANGLAQYMVGDRIWLWEGDYIRKFPEDHNSMVVNRDGKHFDFSRNFKVRNKAAASRVRASLENENKQQSLLSLQLEQYNGVNWTRNINYLARKGLWIIDEVDVLVPGNYGIEISWKSVGNMEVKDQAVQLTQKKLNDGIPYNFFIVEGSGATRFTKTFFESGIGRKDGNLMGYQKSFDLNSRQVVQRKQGSYKKGDKLYYVNFMHAAEGDHPIAPSIHQLTDHVYAVQSGKDYHLAVLGKYVAEGVEIDADRCFMGPEGILASGARTIRVGDYTWSSEVAKDIVVDFKETLGEPYLNILRAQFSKGVQVNPSNPVRVEAAETKLATIKKLNSNVSYMAKQGKEIAVGTGDGTFVLMDEKGNTLFEHKFAKEITAISPIQTGKGTKWAIAVFPEDLEDAKAMVHLLDENRKIAWVKPIAPWHRRFGTVTTMFSAKLDNQGDLALVVGSQGWHYYAFSPQTGELIWRCPITHGATVGAAGDMDGDGLDDIALGAEYYYHQLANHKGEATKPFSASPWNYSVVVKDLDGDGKKEAIFGRGDGWLYVNVPTGNAFKTWRSNVGGRPIAIVDIEDGETKLATATEMGDVVYLDGVGKVVAMAKLPAQLTDLKVQGNKLFATCIDGFGYVLDTKGQILAKYPYEQDVNSLYSPKIAADGGTVSFFSGKNVYSIGL